eukprot:GEMP01033275.1.p2 GENE.GEMP01033275.1~~GEMP01033275.1.p2  ORF type:complete len:144 (+),score=40.31 GEMP01033275.1:106-537(+)
MTILFVCTGNTCRSVMAMFAYDHAAAALGGERSFSRGLAVTDSAMASNAATTLQAENINVGEHRPTLITEDDLQRATKVICMTHDHRDKLVKRFPGSESKVFLLLGDKDLSDPYEMPLAEYRSAFEQIMPSVTALAQSQQKPE